MKTIKFGDKEYNIKYGYKATVQSGIIKKLISMSDIGGDMESVDKILQFLPEMLLVGLQKFHKDEFGYDPDDEKQKAEKMELVYDLLDDYFDGDDGNMNVLFADLQKEMLDNGFLSKMLQKDKKKSKKVAILPENQEELQSQEEN